MVASSCPSRTSDPTSTYSFFTKLFTLAYRSTCWNAINSPGTYKLVESLPFTNERVGNTAALSWCPPALSFLPPPGTDLLSLSVWLFLVFSSPSEEEQPCSAPSASSADANSTTAERLFFMMFIFFSVIVSIQGRYIMFAFFVGRIKGWRLCAGLFLDTRKKQRQHKQRGKRTRYQTSDHRPAQRRRLISGFSKSGRHRDHTHYHRHAGHQDRPQPRTRSLPGGLDRIPAQHPQLFGISDQQHRVGDRHPHRHDHTHIRLQVKRRAGDHQQPQRTQQNCRDRTQG